MSSTPFYKIPKLLSSVEAEAGADHLLERLQMGCLGMEVLPNSYPKFTGQLEEEDYVSYCRFLASSNGKKLFKVLEVQDGRKCIEL